MIVDNVEEFRKIATAYREKACQSKETALAALVEIGSHTPEGKLTKEYGGDC